MVLAQLALRAGYTVSIAGSGSPDTIALSVRVIAAGARAVTSEVAIHDSQIVILALPLGRYQTLPVQALQGKLVIDAMNYWWEVDGTMPQLQAADSSSQMVQAFLRESRVVKALSHMGYHHLLDESRPHGVAGRKAIAVAGDSPVDMALVSELVDTLGFDPVVIGNLAAGKSLEPGQPLFGANLTAREVEAVVKLWTSCTDSAK
jgi:predicted dinucleotide-binding enzyme